MPKILTLTQPKTIQTIRYDRHDLKEDQIRLKTLYSGISAGTQLTLYRGKNPYLDSHWDDALRLFEEGKSSDRGYPVEGMWAYEEVGEVTEVGKAVSDFKIGDRVYGAWGHRSEHVVDESFARCHRLPDDLDPLCGVFGQMGAIAMNAILDADIHVGETVAVFGQGVPGQIIAQLARLNGAEVIAIDLDDQRLQTSKNLGTPTVLSPKSCDVGAEIKRLTEGRGADVAIEITGVAPVLHEAIRSVCYNGRVICSGFITGEAKGLRLGNEFHHNRVQIIGSQISGVSLNAANRWDQVRMEQTVMKLQAEKRLRLQELITHVVPFEKADEAYQMLDTQSEPCLQVVLEF